MNRICATAADAAGALGRFQRHLDGPLAITGRAQRDVLCPAPDLGLAVAS